MPKPTLLKFYLEHNDDEEISCFFCMGVKCEQAFFVRGRGELRLIGVHNGCVDLHTEAMLKRRPAGETNGTSRDSRDTDPD